MDKVCSGYSTSVTCTSKPAEMCEWDATLSMCNVGNGVIDQQWLRNKAYCANSPADFAVTCTGLTSQSACNGNSNCVWQTTPAGTFVGSFLTTVSSWTGASAAASGSGACAPKWVTDSTIVAKLLAAVFGSLNETMANSMVGGSSGAASFLGPIFNDMFGNCSGVQPYKTLLLSCGPLANKATCEALTGCAWTPSGVSNVTTNGNCDIAADFATSLFLNSTDPWVKAVNNATTVCAAQLSNVTCAGVATVNVDPTKFNTFVGIPNNFPTFGTGGAGVAGVSTLMLSLLAGLAILAVLLL